MKKIITVIFIAVLLVSKSYLHGQVDNVLVPYNPKISTKGLKININVGDIHIIGSDREDILVNYEFDTALTKSSSELTDDGLKRITISKPNLEVNTLDGYIMINSSDHSRSLKLRVEVPRIINISTLKGGPGSLNIDNINGNLNLENNSGSILATNIDGIVNASTNEGEISVDFSTLPDDYSMQLVNVIGDIEVQLPENSNVSFRLNTTNGELLTNLDLKELESSEIARQNPNTTESFSYSNNIWSDFQLNSGGPRITLSSMNGHLIIRAR